MAFVYAAAAALIIGKLWLPVGWLVTLVALMSLDRLLCERFLADPARARRLHLQHILPALWIVCVAVFVALALIAAFTGGAEGKVLAVLMAGASLISIMIYLFQAQAHMIAAAVPCTLCLLAVPFIPTSAAAPSPVLGGVGLMLGILGFLGYMARSARGAAAMLARLTEANAAAEERRAEAVERQNEAETANHAKTEFIANMSHELRTPLNAVIGYSEILHEDLAAQSEQRMALDAVRIQRAARHLLGLIEQVLDFSKIDAGKMHADLAPADLPEILGAAVAAVRRGAEAKGVALTTDFADLPREIVTDAPKLRQCLDALLSNACKFTESGAIDVCGRTLNSNGDWVEISVSDTGIGIAPEMRARLFAPFGQADASSTRRFGGLGLGLALVRKTVELLGGSVMLASEPGAGSTFTIRLPARTRINAVLAAA
ncbi:MAG: hypothetical protein JNJ73_20850 [Hyphomonadaceae bacterium]|nr:hypothetical protein [Hyphomonadaceae bacterium]